MAGPVYAPAPWDMAGRFRGGLGEVSPGGAFARAGTMGPQRDGTREVAIGRHDQPAGAGHHRRRARRPNRVRWIGGMRIPSRPREERSEQDGDRDLREDPRAGKRAEPDDRDDRGWFRAS